MSMNDKGAFSPAHIIIAILVIAVVILAGTILTSINNSDETYPENEDRDNAIGYLDIAIAVGEVPISSSASTEITHDYSVRLDIVEIHAGMPETSLQWFIPGLTSTDETADMSAKLIVTYPDGETATDHLDVDYASGIWTGTFSPVLYFEDGHYSITVELGTTSHMYSTVSASYDIEDGVLEKL